MFKRIICVFLSAVLVIGIMGLSVSANENSVFEFVIDDTHHSVTIEGNGIPEQFKEYIAAQLVGISDDDAVPYGFACNLLGHREITGTASHTVHKMYTYRPRCVYCVYEVTTCDRCGELLDEVLVSQTRIDCCPVG